MVNAPGLLAEIRRHNLLVPLVTRQIIAKAVADEKVLADEINQTRSQFLESNGITNDETFKRYIQNRGWSDTDFEWQISLPLRIRSYCKNNFQHKAEAHFLARKNDLDRVVYSLLRTKDSFLARELYLRIEAGEATFGDLASSFSEGPERNTKGIIGPVPMTQAHPTLAEVLRTSKAGELKRPLRVGDWWLVLRVESYRPAVFDETMAQQLSRELFDQWVNEEVARKMSSQTDLGIALDAE